MRRLRTATSLFTAAVEPEPAEDDGVLRSAAARLQDDLPGLLAEARRLEARAG